MLILRAETCWMLLSHLIYIYTPNYFVYFRHVTALSVFMEYLLSVFYFWYSMEFVKFKLIIKMLCVFCVFQWFGEIPASGASVSCFQSVQSWPQSGGASAKTQQVRQVVLLKDVLAKRLLCCALCLQSIYGCFRWVCFVGDLFWCLLQRHSFFLCNWPGLRQCLLTQIAGTCCCLQVDQSGPWSGVLHPTARRRPST